MKKALVYNKYLNTAGGGERAILDCCLALSEIGYDVTITTSASFTRTLGSLCEIFGISGGENWSLKILETEEEIREFCLSERFDLFINGTFCSSLANPAPLGIYSLMFPQPLTPAARLNLLSYQHVIVNSHFTELYTKYWWGSDFPVHALPPPISNSHMDEAGVPFGAKEKIILNVGRFNVDGHCKRQLDAIRAFERFVSEKVFGADWHFYAIGNLNPGEQNQAYLDECRRVGGPNVHIETDVPFSRLQELYRKASVVWQFTGIHLPSGQLPQHCEHLGLVAMDGFCYGALPMVYQRSGVSYMIDHGKTGFTFASTEELKTIMGLFDRAFGTQAHTQMFRAAREYSKTLGFNNFKNTLAAYISEAAR